LNPRQRSRLVLNHPTRSDRGMGLSGTRNHIDCGVAGQLCNQRPHRREDRARRVLRCLRPRDSFRRTMKHVLSMYPYPYRAQSRVPGTKPVSRSAQKPAGNLSQSLRETTRDEHEKSNQAHDAGRPHGIMPGRPQPLSSMERPVAFHLMNFDRGPARLASCHPFRGTVRKRKKPCSKPHPV
jgi:hypothetical protein